MWVNDATSIFLNGTILADWSPGSGLTDYLEFYNYQWLHQALDYQTPAQVYFKEGEKPTDNFPVLLS